MLWKAFKSLASFPVEIYLWWSHFITFQGRFCLFAFFPSLIFHVWICLMLFPLFKLIYCVIFGQNRCFVIQIVVLFLAGDWPTDLCGINGNILATFNPNTCHKLWKLRRFLPCTHIPSSRFRMRIFLRELVWQSGMLFHISSLWLISWAIFIPQLSILYLNILYFGVQVAVLHRESPRFDLIPRMLPNNFPLLIGLVKSCSIFPRGFLVVFRIPLNSTFLTSSARL